MQVVNKKTITLLIALVAVTFFSGCTNWEKKYENLQVAYQNLEGRFEFERARKGQLESELVQGQQTIEQLQKKIADLDQTPAQVQAVRNPVEELPPNPVPTLSGIKERPGMSFPTPLKRRSKLIKTAP